ncbi:hypothetical protein Glove_23g122 [Diversispora epigaea]|uniref:Uncharacterized protein n=1 Tax=Diversispora epigaea TaxID=1348612 RepID=A0A397JL73_9GLOM|nr:hypothetical protein Glove_23g122 [Diversispora epigaea]
MLLKQAVFSYIYVNEILNYEIKETEAKKIEMTTWELGTINKHICLTSAAQILNSDKESYYRRTDYYKGIENHVFIQIHYLLLLLAFSNPTTTTDSSTNDSPTDSSTTTTSSETVPTISSDPVPTISITKETISTSSFTCNMCKVDTSLNTSIHGSSTIITTSDLDPKPETTYDFTTPIPTSFTKTYIPTTFTTTVTIYFLGYTTTYTITISHKPTRTQVYIPPSTVVVLKVVKAYYAVVTTLTPTPTPTPTATSNDGDSINNLNMWKGNLNRMIICLWAIGVAFVYVILA